MAITESLAILMARQRPRRQLQDEWDAVVSEVADHYIRRRQNGLKHRQAAPACANTLLTSICVPAEVVIAPPSLFLLPLKEHCKAQIAVAAQNGYQEKFGAFTGEIR